MLINEAKCLGEAIRSLPIKEKSVFLNFGSQSDSYNKTNSHILKYLINPIKEKYIIKNLDIKTGQGVDFCGDLYDNVFFDEMKKQKIDCILLCNVLEHVTDINLLCKRIAGLLQPDGILIFSGPYDYPKHLDPIDNGFRPSIDEVRSLFPEFKVLAGEILIDHTFAYYSTLNLNAVITNLLRLLTPFYRFKKWKTIVIPKYFYWNRKFKVTCVIFQKIKII